MLVKTFCPAHITGFLEANIVQDSLYSGSKGAGFSTALGVTTIVNLKKSDRSKHQIYFNNVFSEAPVSNYVISRFEKLLKQNFDISVDHRISVPLNSGFGTSGAGALSLALGINESLCQPLTRNEVVNIAHEAEIYCKTGLGTVIAENIGGFEIRTKAGAPGIGKIKKLSINYDKYLAIILHLGQLSTSDILNNYTSSSNLNQLGRQLVQNFNDQPKINNFLTFSRKFFDNSNLFDKKVKQILDILDTTGFIFSMAMFGKTLFSIIKINEIIEIEKVIQKLVKNNKQIIITQFDTQGARLIS